MSFVTTEHFTLQGARAATIAESTSRATLFLGTMSAGMVALGLVATATAIGAAFYTFGLILLSTLSFIGFVTFDRVLQSGIEDLRYARRIERLRSYYLDVAPELADYMASVPPSRRLALQGLHGGGWQVFRTVAGMIGVVTSVLTGSAAGLLAVLASGRSVVVGFAAGGAVGLAVLATLMLYQYRTWGTAGQEPPSGREAGGPQADQ
ncbi:hypothetical protein GCM10010503_39460 [Streptomyces lucensis JCM 4490]|uniref:Uncharacterized protein n=1 Tax=Streptomyces lucensis JCM 4490 TaxID=1306176 RepID=A0A918J7U8_9ACTN|nr:hypothetical protein [Streptomyces lucensis]GGW58499.1 hypothetical protein GCM10010503_39460 [Streptomyces lucensis JCM 4490]